jgi:hypothetical protein
MKSKRSELVLRSRAKQRAAQRAEKPAAQPISKRWGIRQEKKKKKSKPVQTATARLSKQLLSLRNSKNADACNAQRVFR